MTDRKSIKRDDLARIHDVLRVERLLERPHDGERLLAVLVHEIFHLALPDAVLARAGALHGKRPLDQPLANLVMQFNRYRKSPQFRVDDPGLAARKYSGTFDVDDPKSLEEVLANQRDVAVERSGDEVVIHLR